MQGVARLAGVAVSTVSALINGAPKVSQTRSDRIRRAIRELDYHTGQIARSLKVRRTHTIGVVIPDITNAFYPSVFRGIEDAARASGYGVLPCNSNECAEQERSQLSLLLSRRVDGVSPGLLERLGGGGRSIWTACALGLRRPNSGKSFRRRSLRRQHRNRPSGDLAPDRAGTSTDCIIGG